ncbi:hypothetical protein BJV82DRAFT_713762, partial [Fennellomyces sp. T-0311]
MKGYNQINEYETVSGFVEPGQKLQSTLSVTFEGLIQQVCKDISIDYIWLDHMCISQGDQDAKMREIKQMHKIYKNARCTVALVPEFWWNFESGTTDDVDVNCMPNSEW